MAVPPMDRTLLVPVVHSPASGLRNADNVAPHLRRASVLGGHDSPCRDWSQ